MAATVRDIKAADFIQKVTTATTPFNAAASTRLLQFFFCVLVSAFIDACFPFTLPLQFSEHLKKTGKVNLFHIFLPRAALHTPQVPVPEWVDTVKTSTANELAPYDENW
jgi:hypothetical protein